MKDIEINNGEEAFVFKVRSRENRRNRFSDQTSQQSLCEKSDVIIDFPQIVEFVPDVLPLEDWENLGPLASGSTVLLRQACVREKFRPGATEAHA